MKTKFSGILTLLLALMVQISFAQEKTISGTVKDGDGLPLPGVNITITGTDSGTQTDFNGKFSLQAQQGATLKFTFVGFADQTVEVGTTNTINVTMEESDNVLDIVKISNGYKTTTKRRSTKAITTITAENIEDRPNASAVQSLQGQVAGLNIGTNSGQPGAGQNTIILRGVGSINGNIEPLFIIDGVPVDEDNFTNINPNNIASVSVLKGPNATSIYGNRGANGVIVITTKGGSFNQKMTFKYSSQFGYSQNPPLNMELMDSKQKLTFQRDNSLGGLGDGLTDAEIDAISKQANTYWSDYFFRKGKTNRQDFSIASGTKNTTSYTSVSYLEQEGTYIASNLQRFGVSNSVRGRSENEKFNYSTKIDGSFSKSDFDPNAGGRSIFFNPFLNAMQGMPFLSPFDPDGSVTTDGGLEVGDQAALSQLNAPYILLNQAAHDTHREEQIKIIGNMHADYNFAKNLTAAVDFGMDFTSFKNQFMISPYSLLGPFQADARAEFGGLDRQSYSRDARMITRANIQYENTFGQDNKHSLSVNLYTEYNKSYLNGFGFDTRGLNAKSIGRSSEFNETVTEDLDGDGVPDYPYIPTLNQTNLETGLFSYFGTVDYDYNDTYGFSGSIRRDASLRFTDDNQIATFWSVAGRWNIDSESFMDNTAFNLLKLRAAYGTSGNQRISGGYYSGLDLFRNLYASSSAYNNSSGFVPSVIGNKSLKWETTKQANIGIDFGVWKNKLQGTVDVYRKKTVDLYQSKPVSLVNATSAISANIGDLENKGVELTLKYVILNNKDWRISVNGNGSYNKNKILNLPPADSLGIVRNGTGSLGEGHSIGQFFLAKYAGVNPANGHGMFYDIDGNLTENLRDADRVYNSKYQRFPEIQGGFGANISYNNFYLSNQWVYFANVYRNNLDLADMEGAANYTDYNSTTSVLRAWKNPGDITDIPKLNAPHSTIDYINLSDRYLQDASYLRLRNLSVGYTFKKGMLKRLPFTSVKLYVQGENLLTFSKFEGFDAGSAYTGTESSRFPSSQIYTVGLNVQF